VLNEAFANIASGYPDDGVAASIVGSVAVKNVDAEASFFQPLPLSGKSAFDYMSQKLLTSTAAPERGAVQNLSEMGSNEVGVR
jgi:hypothetical protein